MKAPPLCHLDRPHRGRRDALHELVLRVGMADAVRVSVEPEPHLRRP